MGVNCYKGNTTFCSPCYPARTCMPSSQYGGSCGFGGAMVGRCGPAANCWRGSPTTYATYEQAKQYGAFGNFDQCKSYAASRPCGSDIVWQPRRPYQKCEMNEPCAPAPCSTPCTPCGGLGNVCNPSTCGPYAPCGPFGFHTSCAGRPSRPCNPCSGPCIQNVACLARRDGTACGSCCGLCGPCASAASCGPRVPSCGTCAQCGPAGPCKPCASCKPCSSRTSCCPCAGLSTSCNLCAPQYTGNRCTPCRSAACCGPCGQNSACGPCGPCRAPCGQFGRCGRSSSCGPCDSNAHCNPTGVYGPPVPCPPSGLAAPFNPYSPSATYMPGAQCGRVCAPSTCSIPRRTFRYPNYTTEYLAAIRQYCGEPQKKLRVKRVIRKRKETSTEESLTTSKAVAKVKD